MKKKSIILTATLVMICMIATLIVTFTGCAKPKQVEPADAFSQILAAWKNTYAYAATEAVGFDYSVRINDSTSLDIRGRLNPKEEEDNHFEVSLSEGNVTVDKDGKETFNSTEEIIYIGADDDYLYIRGNVNDTEIEKNKFFFELGQVVKEGGSLATSDEVYSVVDLLTGMLFPLVFTDENAEKTKTGYVVSGNLDFLLSTLVGVVPQLSGLVDNFYGVKVSLTVDIDKKSGKAVKNTLTFTDSNDSVTELDFIDGIGNDIQPELSVPAKDDSTYGNPSNILNTTVEGNFGMYDLYDDQGEKDIHLVTMTYEFRMDVDLFEVIGNLIDAGAVSCISDAIAGKTDGIVDLLIEGLFKTEDAKLFFNVYHKCSDSCNAAFCDQRYARSGDGPILTLAYSPMDFGCDLLYIDLAKYMIPKKIGDDITALLKAIGNEAVPLLGGPVAAKIFGNLVTPRITLSMDPKALIGLVSDIAGGKVEFGTVADGGTTDIIGSITDVVKWLSGLDFTKEGGETIDIGKIMNDIFTAANVDLNQQIDLGHGIVWTVGEVINMFIGDTDSIKLSVDKLVYGDEETVEMDIYSRFTESKSWNAKAAPVRDVEWGKDKNNQIKIDGADIYDTDGNVKPMSAEQWKQAFAKGTTSYTANVIGNNNAVNSESMKIVGVYGIDWDLLDQEQTVTIVTGRIDNNLFKNAIGSTLVWGALPANIKNILDTIPGDAVEYRMTISSIADFELTQAEDAPNRFDREREYRFGDALNVRMNATITYGNGMKYDSVLEPINGDKYLSGSGEGAKINSYESFSLEYSLFDATESIDVKVFNYDLHIKELERDSSGRYISNIAVGEEFNIGYEFTTVINGYDGNIVEQVFKLASWQDQHPNTIVVDGEKTPWHSDDDNERMETDSYILRRTWDAPGGEFSGNAITFKKAGTHTVLYPFKNTPYGVMNILVTFNVTEA